MAIVWHAFAWQSSGTPPGRRQALVRVTYTLVNDLDHLQTCVKPLFDRISLHWSSHAASREGEHTRWVKLASYAVQLAEPR
mmetsp:Transcript_821/g.1647  ORF Transcript_821/g.1647 Transcript_821/m.1647 type:complete len:81 (-) Transcript_821:104-346(-)